VPSAISVSPARVEAGSPELIRVTAPPNANVEGHWLGHTLQFITGHEEGTWYALAGVDLEAPIGPSTLAISIRDHDTKREVDSTISIFPAYYRTTTITVEPKFVAPGPEEQAEVKADSELKQRIFAESDSGASAPLWQDNFAAPVMASATDSFGTRRTYNGKLASIHKGADFHAATGTVVHAGNAGTVVLAQHLYYEGNCVMIDHGMGLMSISMHLSRIDVKPGDRVALGQPIGLSGATGRVTGPHLHWAIRWQGVYLDPVKLLHLDLSEMH
jgi:murein DD-endopeptidase MepM/ murein hydrolase activator NlpD